MLAAAKVCLTLAGVVFNCLVALLDERLCLLFLEIEIEWLSDNDLVDTVMRLHWPWVVVDVQDHTIRIGGSA